MKIHLAWIRVSATAAILAGASVQPATAQYAPYRPIPQTATPAAQAAAPAVPRVAAQQPYWQQAAQQAAATSRYQTPVTAQYPQTTAPYVPTTIQTPPAAYAPTAAYAATTAQSSAYPYVAYQPSEAAPAAPAAAAEETMPVPVQNGAPVNGDVNGHVQNGHVQNGHIHNGHVAPANGHAPGCNTSPGYPAGSYYNGGAACGEDYGIGSYFDDPCHDSQWFGGIYFLYMERDRPSPQKLTVAVDHAVAPDPYYPPADRTVLVQSDHDFREGVEIRFGSTFTIGEPCDTCNTGCNGCAPPCPTVYAWEVAWWGLDDDANDVTYVDQPATRIYGMKNFVGLEYDRDGAGAGVYAPVNGYYGYQLPIPAPPGVNPDGYLEVLAQRVRTNFKAQNLELNFIRFPVCDMACGGCDSGCNTGCDANACGCEEECYPSSFSMYGSCGVRYFRADDDFMYANEFREWDAGTGTWDQAAYNGWSYDDDNELYYDVQVDNHLIGPQVGWTMNYCYACRWNFFLNSTLGVFNNHIEHVQQMWSGGGGPVRYAGDGETFYVESDKDDISFLGEMRLGGSYDISCHWRAVAAYRAVAITGVATSTDQIPTEYTNSEWVGIIDSDNSMIVHGLQLGAECRY